MAHAKTYSAQVQGLDVHIVTIEVDTSNGLHSFAIVGLGDKAVDEAKDRVSSAIKNSGYQSPKHKNQKLVISLAPADMRKEGPAFDLGMALAYLLACGEIDFDPDKKIFLGELALDGSLRSVRGVLPMIEAARDRGFAEAFIPYENTTEAGLVEGIRTYPAKNMDEVIGHLEERKGCSLLQAPKTKIEDFANKLEDSRRSVIMDISFIRGQESAKRGLEIAAAGAHNMALYGPPGTGKTMLARAFQGILPRLAEREIVEVTSIYSLSRTLGREIMTEPPFRSPHHTSSYSSLVGGGTFPRPGEITLAHRGVLFLDELPEFSSAVIDALREPIEEKKITVARMRGSVTFPAHCILVAAMNPCPCGYGDERCTCGARERERYIHRISGPLIDRIDIWVPVSKVEYDKLAAPIAGQENTATIRKRVETARSVQYERCKKLGMTEKCNSELSAADMEKAITLAAPLSAFLSASAERLGLSGRGYHRILKLSRTIADLEEKKDIEKGHILEALQYRQKLM